MFRLSALKSKVPSRNTLLRLSSFQSTKCLSPTKTTAASICVATRRHQNQFPFIWKATAFITTAALVNETSVGQVFALEENERKEKRHFDFNMKETEL
jgi:hypothetical protein